MVVQIFCLHLLAKNSGHAYEPSTSININLIHESRPIQKSVESYFNKPLSVSKQKKSDEQLGVMISKEFKPFSLIKNF